MKIVINYNPLNYNWSNSGWKTRLEISSNSWLQS